MKKTCNVCKIEYDESEFLKGRAQCKKCRSEIRNKKYEQKANEFKNLTGNKQCNICNDEKDIKLFKVGNNSCSDCLNNKRRERDSKLNDAVSQNKIECPDGYKFCKYCNVVRCLMEFRENRLKCKPCENKERVMYKKGLIDLQLKKYVLDDDLCKRLKASIRSRLRETLPSEYIKKMSKDDKFNYVEEHLGRDMKFVQEWLEFNYDEEMSNTNYGSYWNIDHVLPIKIFNFNIEQDIKNCMGWYNLMPIKVSQNCRKYTHVNTDILINHLNKLKEFCLMKNIELDIEYSNLCAKHLDAGNPLEL